MNTTPTTVRRDRNPDKTARRNLGIIKGQLRGRLKYPKYGGGSGNGSQKD